MVKPIDGIYLPPGRGQTKTRDHSKNAMLFDPMETIKSSTVKVVAIPYDIYEAAVDATISDAYCCESSMVEPVEKITEDFLLVEDPIRSHIYSINAKYNPDLLETALNARLQTSKFAASISSTTAYNETCRLFEAQASESWESVASTNSIQYREVSAETLSKIW